MEEIQEYPTETSATAVNSRDRSTRSDVILADKYDFISDQEAICDVLALTDASTIHSQLCNSRLRG